MLSRLIFMCVMYVQCQRRSDPLELELKMFLSSVPLPGTEPHPLARASSPLDAELSPIFFTLFISQAPSLIL